MLKKLLLIGVITSSVVSCKLSKQKEPEVNNIEGYRIGDSIRSERFLNAAETTVANRICRDLRAKRNRWEVSRDSLNFNYNVRSRSTCSGSLASYELNASVDRAGGDLVFDTPSRSKFIKDILTDLHPAIDDLCDDVLAGQSDITNTIELSGTRYQTTFYEYNGNFYTLITRFLKDSSNAWRAVLVDESLVVVNERTTNGSLVGLVSKRAQESSCTGSGSTYIDQVIR